METNVAVCGVEIKAQEAVLTIVSTDDENNIHHVECTTKKLILGDDKDVQSLKVMMQAISAFAEKHDVAQFVVKARQGKGERAAGGVTFKIETLFQLSGTPVCFVSAQTLAAFGKKNMAGLPASVNKYQTDSFRAAAWHVNKN